MGSTIVLSKKLQKAWTEDKVDSKSSEVKTNPNTVWVGDKYALPKM